ncbi:MAG TPA: OmpA family protein [Patescibacteria group bacterium]|nr:OmpA family protein [Patescibacteria group bacterium]
MRRIVTWSAPLVLVVVATTGCATKDWVNDKLGKRQAQMDDRLARVDGAVKEAGDATRTAQGRADAAYGRSDEVNTRLTRLWNGRSKRNVVETLEVQFGFDRSDLSDGAQTALLGVVKELKTNADLTVDLEGYTDPTGTREYNVGLSQRRVESVRRYLIENGADLARINSIGMGPLVAANAEHAKLRRVTVRLMVNPTD